MRLIFTALAAMVFCTSCNAPPAAEQSDATTVAVTDLVDTPMTISGEIKAKDGNAEISGIACRPAQGAEDFNCLIVADEFNSVQLARIDGDVVRVGAVLDLPLPTNAAFGDAPTAPGAASAEDVASGRLACRTRAPKEMDLEAITFSDGYFYAVGSHGCSRGSAKYDPAAFAVTRFRMQSGALSDVAYSYRLGGLLSEIPAAGAHFQRPLQPNTDAGSAVQRGMNIEGAAASGGLLLVGLRAPSLDNEAFVVSTAIAELFSNGALSAPTMRRLRLPNAATAEETAAAGGDTQSVEVGIRDMAVLGNGDLLILGGPTEEQTSVRYALYLADASDHVRTLGRLRENGDHKAEALLVLGDSDAGLDLAVMYDGPADGDPRRYRITP